MSESPSVVVDSPVVRIATWRELFVALWHDPGEPSDMRGQYAAQRAFAQRIGREQKIVTLSVVQPRAMVSLSPEKRRIIEEGTLEMQDRVKASAVVISGSGFTAAAIRSVIVALTLVNRPKFPTKVCDSVDTGCDWIARHLAPKAGAFVGPAELRAAYRAISDPPAPSG